MGLKDRDDSQWLSDLRSGGIAREEAVADLREWMRRSAFFYLRRHSHELRDLAADEIEALAEDAAQDAALSVLAKLDAFRGEARFLAWASKFGIGCAMLITRKRQWRDLSLDRLPDGWDESPQVAISKDGWEHPELAAQRHEVWEVLRQVAREDLTEKQRLAFNYILIHGVKAEVVAERLGMTAGALYKLTHDARRKFKKALERRGLSKDEILKAFSNLG
jgi:RNA polymerase sigma-70 factor (ECF subfamily)